MYPPPRTSVMPIYILFLSQMYECRRECRDGAGRVVGAVALRVAAALDLRSCCRTRCASSSTRRLSQPALGAFLCTRLHSADTRALPALPPATSTGITRPHPPSPPRLPPPPPYGVSFIVINPGEPERCARARSVKCIGSLGPLIYNISDIDIRHKMFYIKYNVSQNKNS